mmetsp:Transcript_39307/g.76933  ORF Transcript_39307/g.76933 Transcript_39307/m.76933 type:complete len:242 (+) Transcript_39307:804-1529(+)
MVELLVGPRERHEQRDLLVDGPRGVVADVARLLELARLLDGHADGAEQRARRGNDGQHGAHVGPARDGAVLVDGAAHDLVLVHLGEGDEDGDDGRHHGLDHQEGGANVPLHEGNVELAQLGELQCLEHRELLPRREVRLDAVRDVPVDRLPGHLLATAALPELADDLVQLLADHGRARLDGLDLVEAARESEAREAHCFKSAEHGVSQRLVLFSSSRRNPSSWWSVGGVELCVSERFLCCG